MQQRSVTARWWPVFFPTLFLFVTRSKPSVSIFIVSGADTFCFNLHNTQKAGSTKNPTALNLSHSPFHGEQSKRCQDLIISKQKILYIVNMIINLWSSHAGINPNSFLDIQDNIAQKKGTKRPKYTNNYIKTNAYSHISKQIPRTILLSAVCQSRALQLQINKYTHY